jgi:hypothetical protein
VTPATTGTRLPGTGSLTPSATRSDRFIILQRQLSAAIEREASLLAGLPVPGAATAVAA